LEEAKEEGATHLLIVCDTFDWGNYPISVMPGEDIQKIIKKYNDRNMQQIDEIYNMSVDIGEQRNSKERCWNITRSK
jgi:hypothetical protein